MLVIIAMSIRVAAMAAIGSMAGVVFVKLLGSIGTLEFMAFARNAEQADGHEKQ